MTSSFEVLARRWRVVVVGLVITIGLGIVVYRATPPEYVSRGLVMLLPSKEAVGKGGNPFLGLGGLDLPARVLVAYFSSESAQFAMAEAVPGAEVAVSLDESTRGPVILIEATASTPEQSQVALRYVVDEIPVNLDRLQAEVGAPSDARVTSMELAIDPEAAEDGSSSLRILIAAVALALAMTVGLAYVLDAIVLRRRARSSERDSLGVGT
ncbi:hypothetical protein [Salana multivorans]